MIGNLGSITLLTPMNLILPLLAAVSPVVEKPVPAPAWEYQVDLDLSGRSGSASGSGLSAGGKAEYKDTFSKFDFAARLNRLTSDGQTSADDFHLSGSSERTFSKDNFWYVRVDTGYDHARSLDFLSVAAFGYGRRLLEDDKGSLSLRLGLGHRQEESSLVAGPDVSSLAGDLGLSFDRDLGWAQLSVELSVVPTLDDLADIYARNEMSLEFLGKQGPLSLRLGLLQDYRSKATGTLSELENTYFLRVVYKWK